MIAPLVIAFGIGAESFTLPQAAPISIARPMVACSARPLFMLAEKSSWPAMDDGRSEAELFEEADAVFATLDKNADGDITKDELTEKMATYEQTLVEKVFKSIDSDSSGGISAAEFRKAYVKHPTLRTAPGLGGSLNRE